MASLLGINFGGQRQSYFQVRITIHELTNVPMVAGQFKAKWRIDHSHNLASAIAAATAASTGGDGDEGAKSGDGKERFLHHKKSTSTLNSVGPNAVQGDRDETGSIDSGSIRRQSGKGDDASSTHSGHKRTRKSGHRFLSGLREAFHHASNNNSGGSGNSSVQSSANATPAVAGGSSTPLQSESVQTSMSTDTVTHRKSTSIRNHRPASTHNIGDESFKEDKRKGDILSTKTKRDSQVSTATSHDHGGGNGSHPSQLTSEPRGETASATVKDSRVVWDRHIDVGVRVGVEKQRVASGGGLHHQHSLQDLHHQAKEHGSNSLINSGTATPHGGSRSHDPSMRRSTSTREVPGLTALDGDRREPSVSGTSTPRERDAAENVRYGLLGHSQLRISVKADVPTGTGQSHNADSHLTSMRLGYVAVNLSEFAPVPHTHHHHHHHPHHHHRAASGAHASTGEGQSGTSGVHHHHHQHHHHHHVLARTETRRYLLTDGPTNATIKLTVEMTHVGGSKEYSVPPNKHGLLVGSLAGLASESSPPASKGPSSSVGSDVDSATDGGAGSGSGDHQSDSAHRRGSHAEAMPSGVALRALSDWKPHSVARHSRIPASNLNTTLTHKDTARAVKEAGVGGRLAFSFAAGAHHEQSPEDVIESLFSSSSNNAAATHRSRQRDDAKPRPQEKPSEDSRVKSSDTAVPARQSSTSSLRRKGERSGSCIIHALMHCRKCGRHGEHDKGSHHGNTQGGGVERKRRGLSALSGTTSGDASIGSAADSSSARSDSVRRGESVAETTTRRGSDEGKMIVTDEDRMLSSSPPPMDAESRSSADGHADHESTSSHASHRDAHLSSSMDDAMRPSIDDSLPPNTPPDVARREALDFSHLAPPVNVAPPWSNAGGGGGGGNGETSATTDRQPKNMPNKQSRRTLGLSREAALNAGYRGAGWGTLDLVHRTSRVSIEGNSSVDGDSASEHERGSTPPPSASTFAYRNIERTSSPSPLQRATAH